MCGATAGPSPGTVPFLLPLFRGCYECEAEGREGMG